MGIKGLTTYVFKEFNFSIPLANTRKSDAPKVVLVDAISLGYKFVDNVDLVSNYRKFAIKFREFLRVCCAKNID